MPFKSKSKSMRPKLALTEDELRQVLKEATFIKSYDFQLDSAAEGECTLFVPFQEAFVRPGDLVSGPVFMAAADVAMWLAIMTQLGRVDMAVTVEMKTSFLNAAKREDFWCTAKILKLGRRLIYGVAEGVNSTGKLLTHHTLTYIRPVAEEPDT